MAKYKRRQIFVRKALQLRFVLFMAFVTLLVAAVTTYTCYSTAVTPLLAKLKPIYPQGPLSVMMQEMRRLLVIRLSMAIPLAMLAALFVSHRIAGPLVRINRALYDLSQGKFNFSIHLRKKDELHDVAEHINHLVHSLQHLVGRQRLHVKQLAQTLHNLEEAYHSKGKVLEQIDEAEAVLNSMKTHLLDYRIGNSASYLEDSGSS